MIGVISVLPSTHCDALALLSFVLQECWASAVRLARHLAAHRVFISIDEGLAPPF